MTLLWKLNLILVGVFLVGLAPAGYVTRRFLDQNAERQVIQNARIMMETAMAMRGYTVQQIRPLLAPRLAETFLPQSVPAYSATEIFEELRKERPDFTYKEATLNPTNPRNRAVDWESDLVNEFRRDPSAQGDRRRARHAARSGPLPEPPDPDRRRRVPELPHHARAGARLDGSPATGGTAATAGSSARRSAPRSCQVPMSTPIQAAQRTFRTLMITLVGLFVFTLIAVNLLLQFVVIRPVRRLSAMADRVSRGETGVPEVRVTGRDEVAVLSGSFNRMRISLTKALTMLDAE